MKIFDLTHTIKENMPVYPGTKPPTLEPGSTYESDGFHETILTMFSHTGTHMDPPSHLFPNRTTLDKFPVSQFVGKGLAIDCQSCHSGDRIPLSYITAYGKLAEEAEFLLFYTGWDRYWGKNAYYGDYPYLSDDTIDYILRSKKKGVGLDVIGIDPICDESLTIHKKLFAKNEIVVVENLTNLSPLIGKGLFTYCALPLKYEKSDGAPIRAIAITD